MIVFSCKDLELSFGADLILDHVTFSVNEGDRIGIVGSNGAGKTSLIRILVGEYRETNGICFVHSKIKQNIGYLQQNSGLESELSVYNEFMQPFRNLTEMEARIAEAEKELQEGSFPEDEVARRSQHLAALYERFKDAGGLTYKSRVRSILTGLGFDESSWQLAIRNLSGGQKTRLALGRLLLKQPSVLILDEPTNHLDITSVMWLEAELKAYPGTLLVISHDRAFLDTVTDKTMLIEHANAYLYNAPYSQYAILRDSDLLYQEKMWKQQQKEIARIEAFIQNQRKWNRERNIIAAESRMKQLSRMTILEKPRTPDDPPPISFEIDVTGGNDVLSVQNLSFSYPQRPLFRGVSFELHRGERLFLTGPNGCGKSTFLKAITGNLPANESSYLSGICRIGINVSFSYYAQDLSGLNPENTVFDELYDHANRNRGVAELIPVPKIRSALASFGFRGEEVFKSVASLSGGEKSRLALLKIAYERTPLLILDEPTNHLDIGTRETLEQALSAYKGTMIVVSHDRYFADRLATRTLDISSFNRDIAQQSVLDAERSEGSGAGDYKAEKEKRARLRKNQRDCEKAEARLSEMESALAKVEQDLENPAYAADYAKLAELYAEKEKLEAQMLETLEILESLQTDFPFRENSDIIN